MRKLATAFILRKNGTKIESKFKGGENIWGSGIGRLGIRINFGGTLRGLIIKFNQNKRSTILSLCPNLIQEKCPQNNSIKKHKTKPKSTMQMQRKVVFC